MNNELTVFFTRSKLQQEQGHECFSVHQTLRLLLHRARLQPAAGPLLERVRHMSAENLVPSDEEWLREVVLVSVQLVVDVVVRSVVPEEDVEEVEGEPEAAVVVDPLHRREGEEVNGGVGRHPRYQEGEGAAHGVEEEALDGVVVLAPKGVGDDEAVVPGVDVLVQELVQVHVSVPEVLPRVDDKHADEELARYHDQRG